MAYALAAGLAIWAIWVVAGAVRQFRDGLAIFDFWQVYPKFEASRSGDAPGFWLILLSRLAFAGISISFSALLVLQS
ncbi:MAG: hypothetical protein KGZ65_13935 [Sphingomonadales bacterium]|nr:hypothetical protein [Sphingomonadaceae bacterium]MBS3932326.1 hypothetical protein [Sphingomonadales bacterium]